MWCAFAKPRNADILIFVRALTRAEAMKAVQTLEPTARFLWNGAD